MANGALKLQDIIRQEFPGFKIQFLNDETVRILAQTQINLMPFMKFFEENNLTVYEAKLIRPSLEEVFVKVSGIEIEKLRKEKERGRR